MSTAATARKYGWLIGIDRTKRVKEARDEAKKEIDAYKKSKDDEFKKFESEVGFLWHHPSSPPSPPYPLKGLLEKLALAQH